MTKCCASASGVPRYVPPSRSPSPPCLTPLALPTTMSFYKHQHHHHYGLATSCKTTQGQVGNKRKTFIVLCRKLFPIYVGGSVAVSVCVCVCVRVTVVIVLCQVLPSPNRIRSRIASHNVPYIMVWRPYNAPSYMHGMPLSFPVSLSASLSISGVSSSLRSFATFKCIARCP